MAPITAINGMLNQLNDDDISKVISYIGFLVYNSHKSEDSSKKDIQLGIACDLDLYDTKFDLVHGFDDEIANLFEVAV